MTARPPWLPSAVQIKVYTKLYDAIKTLVCPLLPLTRASWALSRSPSFCPIAVQVPATVEPVDSTGKYLEFLECVRDGIMIGFKRAADWGRIGTRVEFTLTRFSGTSGDVMELSRVLYGTLGDVVTLVPKQFTVHECALANPMQ